MTKQQSLILAIELGLRAGGDSDDWDDPMFSDARELTEEFGCTWDFESWKATLLAIQGDNPRLGGVDLTEEADA